MRVYDVVQIIGPNHIGSMERGRYIVNHFDKEEEAWRWQDICMEARFDPNNDNRFEVECRCELCPGRACPYGNQANRRTGRMKQ